MTPRTGTATILLCAASFGCLLLAVPVQDRIETRLQERAADPDLLYFSSPATIRALALGHDGLIADLYWMRTIQYYGRRDEADRRTLRYKNLAALLDITTTLDPDLLDAFRAGSNFLAEPEPIGAGQPEKAIRLLDKGIALHPEEWRLRFDKGMIYFWFQEDFQKAGQVFLEAFRVKGAPYWLEPLSAMAFSKGGQIDAAVALWQRQLRESDRAEVRENAKNHLISFQVAEERWGLEYLIEQYRLKTGSRPEKLEDLVRAEWLRAAPVDPSGVPYVYDPSNGEVRLSPDTKVRYLQVPEIYKESFLAKFNRKDGFK
jgi:tetratricopeptide (TPR) repeat protein